MSFLDPLFKRFMPSTIEQKTVPSGFFSFFGPTSLPKIGEMEASKFYQGWVYACTNAIAERVADIEIKLERKTGKTWERIEDHPALQLLHDVNDFTSSSANFFLYEVYQQLNGNSFWYIDYNKKGDPCEIWQLDPTRVQVVKDKDTFISGYVYTPQASTKIPLETTEVIHFKRPNPNDPYRGIGTVQAAGLAIDTDKYAAEYQRNFFGNSASPSGIVSTDGNLTQEQFDRLKMQWDSKFKGIQNAHKVAIMEAGMKWTPTVVTAREMQFSESRKDLRDEILAIFGVPKPILGILDDVNLASAQAVEYIFAKYKVKPRMGALVNNLNEFYLPLWHLNPLQYRLNYVDPIPQNIELELKVIANGRGAGGTNPWLTINEARARFNYEPVENGDELERSNLDTPIDGSDQPDDPARAQQDEDEENNEEDGEKSVKKKALTKSRNIERSEESIKQEQDYKQEQIAKLHKTYLDLNTKLEKDLLKRLKKYKPKESEKAIDPINESYAKHLLRLFTKDTAEQVGASDEMVNWLFESDAFNGWVSAIYNASEDKLKQVYDASGRATFADLLIEGSFDLKNPRAVSWIKDNALRDTESYTGTIKENITNKLVEGIDQGFSTDKIADSISEYFTTDSDYQASRMARTEVINSYSAANLEAYVQSGIVDGKYWIPDSKACPRCEFNEADGVIPLDADFWSGDPCPTAHPNAVFEGYSFASYGSLNQILRSRYDGPAITLEAVLEEDSSDLSLGNSSLSNNLLDTNVIPEQSNSELSLLFSDGKIERSRRLTIGPNHPMLTHRGFVKARDLHEGDKLIYDLRGEFSIPTRIESDLKKVPFIEDGFDTIRPVFGTTSVASASSYFHGDETFIYGEVEAIRPTRSLLTVLDSSGIKKFCKCNLSGADAEAEHVATCSSCKLLFKGLFSSTNSDVSRGDNGSSLGQGATLPPFFKTFRIVSCHKTSFSGYAFDASTQDTLYAIGGFVVKNCECSLGGRTASES